MNWAIVKLGEIAEFSNGINFDKSAYSKGVKLIGVSNFSNRIIPDYSELVEVKADIVRKNDYLQDGDIVFVRSNGNKELVGRCMLIDHPLEPVTFSGFVIRCRIIDKEKFNPLFLTYHFKDKAFRRAMSGTAVGANIQNLSQERLSNYEAFFPDFTTQCRIAEILSAYDDLIENNRKQIKLLEEAAQRLYKEWFVDLRFPGYETTPIVDGLPDGWIIKPINEFISYEIGGGWGEEIPTNKCDNEAFVIRGTDLYGITHGSMGHLPFRYHTESNLAARALCDGDIVFEVSGGSKTEGVAKCSLIKKLQLEYWNHPVMCASFCKLVRPREGFSHYLHDCFKHLRASGKTEEYDKRSASSIVNYRWKDFLHKELIFLPDKTVLNAYCEIAEKLYSKIVSCSIQIDLLCKARDSLLPKLMSGEMEI
jgi:type I restriction enzyme S subunit